MFERVYFEGKYKMCFCVWVKELFFFHFVCEDREKVFLSVCDRKKKRERETKSDRQTEDI